MTTLAPSDWVVLVAAIVAAAAGLFIGFSGMLAFCAGTLAAAAAVCFGWAPAGAILHSGLARTLAVAVLAIFAFGIVRALVRRTIKLTVAQPGDAVFGAMTAGIAAFVLALGVVYLAQILGILGAEDSLILSEVLGHVG